MALQIFLLLAFQSVYGYVYAQLAILIGLFMAGIALGSWLAMRRSDAQERLVSGFVSGHDFSRAALRARNLGALQLAEKLDAEGGGGFNPRITPNKSARALAPDGVFSLISPEIPPSSAPAGRFGLATTQLLLALAGPVLLLVVGLIGNFSSPMAAWIAAQVIFPALAALAGMLGGFQFVVAAGIFLRDRAGRSGLGVLYAIDLVGGCAGALVLSGFLIPVFGFWKTAWLVAGINVAAALLAARASGVPSAGQRLAALGGIAPDFPDIPRRKISEDGS